jgi:hypothetical protein
LKSEISGKILFVAYYYPPMGTVGFLRNYFISKCFSKIFEKIFIISVKNITIPSKDYIPVDFAEIFRVYNFDYRNLMNLVSGNKKDLRKNINAGSNSNFVSFLRKIIDSFPFNSLIGEGGLFYIINGTIKGLRLIKKNHITHLYSSYRPIADHIIAFNLKLIFPNLRWIADFRDLPVDNYRKNVFYPGFHNFIYKLIFSKTDHVICVSEGLSYNLKAICTKPLVIRNGIYGLFPKNTPEKFDKFTISYAGSLYQQLRDPAILLKSVKELMSDNLIDSSKFQIVYIGKDSQLWQKWIDENEIMDISITHGELKLNNSILIQNKSHINLILTWSDKNQKGIITGKFYEYLNTGSPILCLINGSLDEEVENIYNELNAGSVFYNGEKEILKKWILDLYSEWVQTGKIEFKYNQENLSNYSWENKTEELKNILFAI